MTTRSGRGRQNAKQTAPEPETPVQSPDTPDQQEIEETPTMSTDTESPAAPDTEAPADTDTTETPAPAPELDLSAFQAAVDAAVEARDTTTGDVPRESLDAVKSEFHALSGLKPKNAARKSLTEALKAAIMSMDAVKGKAVMDISDVLSEPVTASATPADPAEAFKQRLIVAHLAYSLVAADVPEGVDSDKVLAEVGAEVDGLTDVAHAYYTWFTAPAPAEGAEAAPEPEAPPLVVQAVKQATGKPPRVTKSGKRGNVIKHLVEVVGQHESGEFLLMRTLVDTKTAEYPEGVGGSGALHGRLFPPDGKKLAPELAAILVPTRNADGKTGVTVL